MTAAAANPPAGPLRVLVLAPHAFYIDRGTPIDVDILVRAITARSHTVDLLVYDEGEGRDYAGLTIERAGAPKWLGHIGPGFSVKKLVADVFMFWRAIGLVRKHDYDLVHAGEESVFMAMAIKLFFGIPYAYDMDSSIAQQMVEKMPWLHPVAGVFNWFEARAIRGAIACSPVCNALGDLARERGAKHIEVLHDISQIDPDVPTDPAGVRKKHAIFDPIFMYVGNLETYQGVGLLLEGLAHARADGVGAHVVVAGGSDAHIEKYKTKAADLNVHDHVTFVGRWPVEDLGALLAEADVLVAPRTRGINTPQKIFPYMHSGKAVLLTKLPTHTQLLDGSEACLAEATPEAFGRAIGELAADPGLRAKLGKAGRAFVEKNHTYPAHQARVDALYAYIAWQLGANNTDAAHVTPAGESTR
ncbi:MAG: hypothetical protein DHS20C14_12260 [Phycisphaeraceae bacterium]|nr:MAG: hypothetical protein DHS20C14_12260 [Phycisphaeraceae bacterium]